MYGVCAVAGSGARTIAVINAAATAGSPHRVRLLMGSSPLTTCAAAAKDVPMRSCENRVGFDSNDTTAVRSVLNAERGVLSASSGQAVYWLPLRNNHARVRVLSLDVHMA